MAMLQQILNDIAAAPTLEFLAQIWDYCTRTFAAGSPELEHVGSACQARDAQLRGCAPWEPAPAAPAPAAVAMPAVPAGPKPPGILANATAIGIGTRDAAGVGGLPALDNLRVALVDLATAAWDCGLDLSQVSRLADVQAADHATLWEIASQMLHEIREWTARAKASAK
jgi:hypothetical protein